MVCVLFGCGVLGCFGLVSGGLVLVVGVALWFGCYFGGFGWRLYGLLCRVVSGFVGVLVIVLFWFVGCLRAACGFGLGGVLACGFCFYVRMLLVSLFCGLVWLRLLDYWLLGAWLVIFLVGIVLLLVWVGFGSLVACCGRLC